jgi:hypothetical protein
MQRALEERLIDLFRDLVKIAGLDAARRMVCFGEGYVKTYRDKLKSEST